MKILQIIFFLIFPAITNAQQLVPFDQWERSTPKWKEDFTEIAYVAARCASINYTVGYYLGQEGSKPEDFDFGQKFITVGKNFSTIAFEIGINLSMSDKFIYDRHEALTKIYAQKLAENKKIYNQIFAGDFGVDFKYCIAQIPFFKSIVDGLSVDKQQRKK